MINLTSEAIGLLNQVNPQVAGSVFERVLNQSPITDVELQQQLNLPVEEAQKLLKHLQVIAKEAAYNSLDDEKFAAPLAELGLSQSLIQSLAKVWTTEQGNAHDRLVDKSFSIADERLVHADWKLKLVTGHSGSSVDKHPLVQLSLTTAGQGVKSVELGHDQLSRLYQSLEHIQAQIDQIHKQ